MTCLGDVVAALVDGELEHAARERAQRHLAHCAGCRAEVEAHRNLKTRLVGTWQEPAPSDALTARLLQMRPPVEGAPRSTRPLATRPLTPRPFTPRAAAGPRRRRSRRGIAVGSALAVLGIGAALALGSPPATRPSTPLNPGSDVFVVDFVSSTSDTGSVGGGR